MAEQFASLSPALQVRMYIPEVRCYHADVLVPRSRGRTGQVCSLYRLSWRAANPPPTATAQGPCSNPGPRGRDLGIAQVP